MKTDLPERKKKVFILEARTKMCTPCLRTIQRFRPRRYWPRSAENMGYARINAGGFSSTELFTAEDTTGFCNSEFHTRPSHKQTCLTFGFDNSSGMSPGGFNPISTARWNRCMREMPTQGPYFDVTSNRRRIISSGDNTSEDITHMISVRQHDK